MVVGTCHLQGRQLLPWGRSPVSFRQNTMCVVFQGKSWIKGPSSLALPRMVHHPWLAALDVIWHIYSHLYCSLRDGGRDLLSSGEAAPTMGQVPCEFWVDRPNFIFHPVALDVIWHIYSHLYCSLRDGGRDLPSSGEAAPTMGKVCCEFQAECNGCSFSGEELNQGFFQPCPAQDGASSMTSSSWCDFVLTFNPAHSKCGESHQEPLAEKWRLADLLKTHRGPSPSWGQYPLKKAGPYLIPPWRSAAQSKCAKSHQEPLAEKWTHRGPAPW